MAPVAKLWAVVTALGGLTRGSNVTSVTKPVGTGSYRVLFNQAVNDCAWIAAQANTTSGTQPSEAQGFAFAAGDAGSASAVLVFTTDKGGSNADRSFHLAVFCP